ncbi:MAG: PAS domain S-box protein [Planctomycetales bacterium]|nr:PAS domain S-box protein [Planctomycetales bacterium]
MEPQRLFERYRDLQRYLDWTEQDRLRVLEIRAVVLPHLEDLTDDFYAEILRHEATASVLTEGAGQIARLKQSLSVWLEQLVSGQYDEAYVAARWQVGLRHTKIGLHQVYTNAAMARLRRAIHRILQKSLDCPDTMWATIESVNKLLDLDLAIIEDSYEHHRLETEKLAERQRSEQKFRNLVEAAACMIVILRDDLSVAYFSPFAERLSGYECDEVVGRPYEELFSAHGDTSAVWCEWLYAIRHLPVSNCELSIRSRDGSVRWLAWNIIRLDDFDRAPAVLAVGHDITEKRRSAELLLQSERLAAIGQTITGLAHESRNALQRINSCTELLEFEVEENAQAIQLIRRIQQAQDDLARLFDEVRSFAAPIQLDRSTCSLPSIWRDAWHHLQNEQRGRQIEFSEDVEEATARASVDRFRLTQVFRNLFENSLAAGADPLTIRVTCRALPGPPNRLRPVADESEASQLEIRVIDNGPGLDDRARRQVFQPFFTTKAKGTGLGMAIAHRILAAHGGSIAVEESTASGAEFVLTLPRNPG